MYEIQQSVSFPLIGLWYEGMDSLELFTSWYQPILITFMVGFFMMFDFTPNFYAELYKFADR